MERLPYIDEHSREVFATPAATWTALISVVRSDLGGRPPAAFIRAWRLEPASRRGEWTAPEVGDALPGFEVREVEAPARLVLYGRHRFSRYGLIFELDELDGGARCRVRAQTRATFPGLLGSGYRSMVIGTRMHRVVVRRLLGHVAERA